ncbi:allergen [Penicillium verrucosum]|uniref:allergen n=1 Tax=Penicillium verrucosum TaxID=60171 RepID=UPI0025456803|nr:allergen [Penicillium verrucosum]KAJ5920169.1 allergen [Penicillium verrucosum]
MDSTLQPGDSFPDNVVFQQDSHLSTSHKETSSITSCGVAIPYNASKEWSDKKVVLVSVPGAFTRTCSGLHLPNYIENLPALKKKGVDLVAIISFNDANVMSGWGKANNVTNNDIIFLSDPNVGFSKSINWAEPSGHRGLRYAIVIDHGKVIYAQKETERGNIQNSGAESILPFL